MLATAVGCGGKPSAPGKAWSPSAPLSEHIEALASPDKWVYAAAFRELQLAGEVVVPFLLGGLRRSEAPDIQSPCLMLISWRRDTKTTKIRNAILRLEHEGIARIRGQAAGTLIRMFPDDASGEQLAWRLLEDDEEDARTGASFALSKLDPFPFSRLKEIAETDTREGVRIAAIKAICQTKMYWPDKDPRARAFVLDRAQNDPSSIVRKALRFWTRPDRDPALDR